MKRISSAFFTIGIMLCLLPTQTHAVQCHQITSDNGNMPAVIYNWFAPPYNLLSAARELFIRIDCGFETLTVNIGNGAEDQYVYEFVYPWYDGAWQAAKQLEDTGAVPKIGPWFVGNASGTFIIDNADIQKGGWIAAHVCTWDIPDRRWKCGCLREECDHSGWNMQRFQNP